MVPTPLFRDPEAPLNDRAQDLLARLTRDERIAMLHQHQPAIERLGLAEFHTGQEALHGVGWLGKATVFPQPVGMAATWDTDLIRRIGQVAGIEVRAKRCADPKVGLNVWAPVVNTLRHPAWGRNEEGYSEDPHVTALFGGAYAQGLKGDHERVWNTVPTLKHFLGYNNEGSRTTSSSNMDQRILHEEELPAFRGAVETGAVGGIMPSYNRVNGTPAHVSADLIAELRRWHQESIAFVTDAYAPTSSITEQYVAPDRPHMAAMYVNAGVDSFTDQDDRSSLTTDAIDAALDAGLLTMETVDAAVLRLLQMRIRTGEFDGDADPYSFITADHIDLPEHRAVAREAATKAVVILENDGVLPLTAPQRIAVVGPLADEVKTDWYSGTTPYDVTIAGGLAARYPGAVIDVHTGADTIALRSVTASKYVTVDAAGERIAADSTTATQAAQFDMIDWGDGIVTLRSAATGRLLTMVEGKLAATATRVGGWVTQETFKRHLHADGTFSLLHLGSGRWLQVLRGTGTLTATDGKTPELAERFAIRTLRSGHTAIAEAASRADAVVVAVGNDPHINGRETEDRPHLRLPEAFAETWRAARDANEHAILAIVSSYPYVLGPTVDDARAIVWTSHAGQELGTGIAAVLSGDAEPTGRLAQSWPATEAQAGDLFDYDTYAQRMTYRHYDSPPRYAFGHGLTYSTVEYRGIELDVTEVDAPLPSLDHPALREPATDTPTTITATVSVANTGTRVAHELVQVYALGGEHLALETPRRLLLGFARVTIQPGETRAVEIRFDAARLGVWDPAERVKGAPEGWLYEGALRVQPGAYTIAAGPSSFAVAHRTDLTVIDRAFPSA